MGILSEIEIKNLINESVDKALKDMRIRKESTLFDIDFETGEYIYKNF